MKPVRVKVECNQPAHKSGAAWVRIASSVQAWIEVHWEAPGRLEPIRIPGHLIPINALPAEDCTLEAMRAQACANQCMDFKRLLFAKLAVKSGQTTSALAGVGRPSSAIRAPSSHATGPLWSHEVEN
jgi:hypothetical protein